MIEKRCVTCGKVFLTRVRRQKSCSRACRPKPSAETRARMSEAKRGRKKQYLRERTCIGCGQVFKPKTSKQRACCVKCRPKPTKAVRKQWSEQRAGENNPFFGREHTDETRALLAEKARARGYWKGEKNPQHGTCAWKITEARDGERGGTKAELKFEALVKGFQKQYVVERGGGQFPYRIDFALPTIRLAVEIDGVSHRSRERRERDRRKDAFLAERGWTMLRLTNRELLRDPRAVADRVWRAVADLIPEDEPCPAYCWA